MTKLAPAKMVALLMGLWFFATAIAEFLAGQLAALTDKIARGEIFHLLGGQADFYLVLVVAPLVAGGLLFALTPWLRRPHARARRVKARPAAIVLLLCLPVGAAAKPSPIPTHKDDVVDRLHGVDVPDPYRWLEDADAPEVKRWTDAQNAATRHALDRVPGRAALEKRFWQLYEIGSVGVPVSRPQGARRVAISTRGATASRTSRSSTCATARAAPIGPWSTSTRERADGTRALDWWFPSDDGALVAYGVSDDGSEESTLRVRDAATGMALADEIPRTRACSLAWTPDGRGFYYTRYPAPGEVPAAELKYHRAVYHHRLGDDPAKDRKLFGDGRDMTDWPGVDLSPNGRWLAITVSQGWSKSEVYVADVRAGRAPVAVAAGEPSKFNVVETLDDRLYLFTTSGAPRGRLFAVDPARPDRAHWREVIKESSEVLQDVVCFRGGIAAASLQDAALRLRLYDAEGAPRGEIALPGLGALTGLTGARDAAEINYGFTSFLVPTQVFRVDVTTPNAPRRRHVVEVAGADRRRRVRGRARDGDVARRHEAAAFPRPPERNEARRRAARPADRLRRLRSQHAADVDAVGDPVSRGGRHLRGRRPAGRRRVRRGLAPRRHVRRTSKTCSTTSSRPPNGWSRTRSPARRGWRSRDVRTAACWWARC